MEPSSALPAVPTPPSPPSSDGCPTCSGTAPSAAPASGITAPTLAQSRSATLGFLTGSVVELPDGRRYYSMGVSSPGFGVADEACVIQPNPGQTADDVVSGGSVGFGGSTPGAGVDGSVSGNASGVMACSGPSVSTGGPAVTGTYAWSAPSREEFDAGNAQYKADQNAQALAASHQQVSQLAEQDARDRAALAEMDPSHYK